jgi:MYXO-CTERM domain-containing protein
MDAGGNRVPNEGGCGCRVGRGNGALSLLAGLGLIAALLARKRR